MNLALISYRPCAMVSGQRLYKFCFSWLKSDTVGCDITPLAEFGGSNPHSQKEVAPLCTETLGFMYFIRCLLSSQAEIPSISVLVLAIYGYCAVLPCCLLCLKSIMLEMCCHGHWTQHRLIILFNDLPF